MDDELDIYAGLEDSLAQLKEAQLTHEIEELKERASDMGELKEKLAAAKKERGTLKLNFSTLFKTSKNQIDWFLREKKNLEDEIANHRCEDYVDEEYLEGVEKHKKELQDLIEAAAPTGENGRCEANVPRESGDSKGIDAGGGCDEEQRSDQHMDSTAEALDKNPEKGESNTSSEGPQTCTEMRSEILEPSQDMPSAPSQDMSPASSQHMSSAPSHDMSSAPRQDMSSASSQDMSPERLPNPEDFTYLIPNLSQEEYRDKVARVLKACLPVRVLLPQIPVGIYADEPESNPSERRESSEYQNANRFMEDSDSDSSVDFSHLRDPSPSTRTMSTNSSSERGSRTVTQEMSQNSSFKRKRRSPPRSHRHTKSRRSDGIPSHQHGSHPTDARSKRHEKHRKRHDREQDPEFRRRRHPKTSTLDTERHMCTKCNRFECKHQESRRRKKRRSNSSSPDNSKCADDVAEYECPISRGPENSLAPPCGSPPGQSPPPTQPRSSRSQSPSSPSPRPQKLLAKQKSSQLPIKQHQLPTKQHQLSNRQHQLSNRQHQLSNRQHQLHNKQHRLPHKQHQLSDKPSHRLPTNQPHQLSTKQPHQPSTIPPHLPTKLPHPLTDPPQLPNKPLPSMRNPPPPLPPKQILNKPASQKPTITNALLHQKPATSKAPSLPQKLLTRKLPPVPVKPNLKPPPVPVNPNSKPPPVPVKPNSKTPPVPAKPNFRPPPVTTKPNSKSSPLPPKPSGVRKGAKMKLEKRPETTNPPHKKVSKMTAFKPRSKPQANRNVQDEGSAGTAQTNGNVQDEGPQEGGAETPQSIGNVQDEGGATTNASHQSNPQVRRSQASGLTGAEVLGALPLSTLPTKLEANSIRLNVRRNFSKLHLDAKKSKRIERRLFKIFGVTDDYLRKVQTLTKYLSVNRDLLTMVNASVIKLPKLLMLTDEQLMAVKAPRVQHTSSGTSSSVAKSEISDQRCGDLPSRQSFGGDSSHPSSGGDSSRPRSGGDSSYPSSGRDSSHPSSSKPSHPPKYTPTSPPKNASRSRTSASQSTALSKSGVQTSQTKSQPRLKKSEKEDVGEMTVEEMIKKMTGSEST